MDREKDGPNAQQIAFWNADAAARWVAQQNRIDRMLAGAQDALLKAAAPQPGERIADIGCGCGTTALALAAASAPSGAVLGIDVSRPLLAQARLRHARSGHANLSFLEADASVHTLEPSSLDLIVSRFGVMFFDDPEAAFVNLRKGLKPQGRLVFVCWADPRKNGWVHMPLAAVKPHVPPQPPVPPGAPGPFAFADIIRIRNILDSAGFDAVAIKPLTEEVSFGTSAQEAAEYLTTIGPVSRLLQEATEAERARATAALHAALAPLVHEDGVRLGLDQWLVTARNP